MAHHHEHGNEASPGPNRSKWILIGFLAVAGFFLITEHQAHLYGALPYLLILICPLMHLFHGHGNGHHGGPERHDESANTGQNARPTSPLQENDSARRQ